MKLIHATFWSLALMTSAHAQNYSTGNPVPGYGETDKDKTRGQIEFEKKADDAYKRALGNVPTGKQNNDPWGDVRNDGPAKPAAKAAAKAGKSTSK